MGWESSGVDGFDLWSLLQGQMRIAKLKSAYKSLIIKCPAKDACLSMGIRPCRLRISFSL